MKLSIVLGSYNRLSYLKLALESIRQEIALLNEPAEIIVIDGGSTDGTVPWLVQQKDVIGMIHHNRGEWRGKQLERKSWGYFMNLAFRAASGQYICMLSDDCLVIPGSIKRGVTLFDTRLNQGVNLGGLAFYWRNWPKEKEYMVGLTLGGNITINHGIFLKSALSEVGFINETDYIFYYADGDLCLKLWHRGYVIEPAPQSIVEHYANANQQVRQTNNERERQDWKTYLKNWKGIYDLDTKAPTKKTIDFVDPENSVSLFLQARPRKEKAMNLFTTTYAKHLKTK